jgi:selenide,water dikinase
MAPAGLVEYVTHLMALLNRSAAEIMSGFDIHACTDVTGFGLLGHLAEMVCGSGMAVRVFSRQVPVIPEALEYASMGLIPAGAYKNKEFRESMVTFADTVERSRRDVLFDPQTSGGLLISVKADQSMELVAALKNVGIGDAAEIGEVLHGQEEKIRVS